MKNTVQLFFENGLFSFVVNLRGQWIKEDELTELIGELPRKEVMINGYVELKYIKPYKDYLKVLIVKGFMNIEKLGSPEEMINVLVIKGITYAVGDP
jgi:hypothetical protein